MCSDRNNHAWILPWAFLLSGFTGLFFKLVPWLRAVSAEISRPLFQFSNTFLVRTTFFFRGGGVEFDATLLGTQFNTFIRHCIRSRRRESELPRDAESYPRIAGVLSCTVVRTWRLAAFRVFIRYRVVQKPLETRCRLFCETVGVYARFPERFRRHVNVERRYVYFEPFRKSVGLCIVSVTFS
jgi:hypothetical protein